MSLERNTITNPSGESWDGGDALQTTTPDYYEEKCLISHKGFIYIYKDFPGMKAATSSVV
jgi:hypothetical protein